MQASLSACTCPSFSVFSSDPGLAAWSLHSQQGVTSTGTKRDNEAMSFLFGPPVHPRKSGLCQQTRHLSSYFATQPRCGYYVSTWSVTFAFFRQVQARAQPASVPRPGKGGAACHSLQGISYAA